MPFENINYSPVMGIQVPKYLCTNNKVKASKSLREVIHLNCLPFSLEKQFKDLALQPIKAISHLYIYVLKGALKIDCK